MPSALIAQGQAVASLEGEVANLQSTIESLLSAQANMTLNPPSLASSLASVQQMLAALTSAIALGLPALSATPLVLLAAQIGDLGLQLGALNLKLAAVRGLGATLGTAGVSAYAFQGTIGNMGGELSSELISGTPGGQATDAAGGVVFVATTPVARAALGIALGIEL